MPMTAQITAAGRSSQMESLSRELSMIHCQNFLVKKIETIGASHTDAGVHALGNVAVFDTQKKIPKNALNQRLPEDIRIQLSEEVEPDFHPRYCDSEKTYEYRILNRKFPRAYRKDFILIFIIISLMWKK